MNALVLLLWGAFLLLTLRRRWNLPVTVALLLTGIAVGMRIGLLIPYDLLPYRMLFALVALALLALLIFSDKPGKVVLAAGLMYLANVICEVIVLASVPNVSASTDWLADMTGPERVQMLVFYVAVLATLLFFTSRLFTRRFSRLSTKEWLLFSLFPASQTLLMCLWVLSSRAGALAPWPVIAGVLCALADALLYAAFRGMAQRAELKAQNDLLASQIAVQKQHYADLAQQYQRIRVLRHDIANHVRTIQVLLKDGELQQAQKYAAETMEAHTFRSALGTCENPVVDAFLTSRIEDARAQGVAIEADVRLPYQLRISDTDLITVFGNLLDNAVEASLPLPEEKRRIRLSAATRDGYLAVRMENALPEREPDMRKSGRIDGLERGLGFHILNDLAKQYHGAFRGGEENGLFVSTLTVRLEEPV